MWHKATILKWINAKTQHYEFGNPNWNNKRKKYDENNVHIQNILSMYTQIESNKKHTFHPLKPNSNWMSKSYAQKCFIYKHIPLTCLLLIFFYQIHSTSFSTPAVCRAFFFLPLYICIIWSKCLSRENVYLLWKMIRELFMYVYYYTIICRSICLLRFLLFFAILFVSRFMAWHL